MMLADEEAGGYFSATAGALLITSVGLVALALTSPRRWESAPAAVWAVVAFGLGLSNARIDPQSPLIVGLAVTSGLAAGYAAWQPNRRWIGMPLLVSGVAVASIMVTFWTWGHRRIDVFVLIQRAGLAILHGANPYAVMARATIPGVRYFHFPYGPAIAVLAAPGAAIGDVRSVDLVLSGVTYGLLVWAAWRLSGRSMGVRVAACAIALPATMYMTLQSWPEPYGLVFVVGWLVTRDHHRTVSVLLLALGLLCVLLVVPAVVMVAIGSRRSRRDLLTAAAGAGAVYAAIAISIGPAALWSDMVAPILRAPTYAGSLSVNGALTAYGLGPLPWWVGLTVGAIVLAALARWPAPDLGSACARAGLGSAVMFMFAKWAFFDYYYIAIVMILCGLALAGARLGSSDEDRLTMTSAAADGTVGLSPG